MSLRAALLLAPLLLLAACSTPRPYAPVDDVRYTAIGADPFWMVTIGDDRIVLRLAGTEGPREESWPRTLPATRDGVTRWESGAGTRVIAVEARKSGGSCTHGGVRFEDQVRVTLSGRMLEGCGGRIVAAR